MPNAPTAHAFSVNVEDWFCSPHLRGQFDPRDWYKLQPRLEPATLHLLDLLDVHRVRGTFFVPGWVAGWYVDLVGEIARRGHEVGCHGHAHRRVDTLTPHEFEQDLQQSLEVLESATGSAPIGYRAPDFSLGRSSFWAYEIMARHGIRYDASLAPGGRDEGDALAPHVICAAPAGIVEFPCAYTSIGKRMLPVGGGESLRMTPASLTRRVLRARSASDEPVAVWVRSWELDPGQPQVDGLSIGKRVRQYGRLQQTEQRLHRLFEEFAFTTMRGVLELEPAAAIAHDNVVSLRQNGHEGWDDHGLRAA